MSQGVYRGVGFPIQISEGGLLSLKVDEPLIEDSVFQILGTRLRERVMLPEFGSRLRDMIFEQLDAGGANRRLIAYNVSEAINRWDNRIKLIDLIFFETEEETEAGIIRLSAIFQIVGTNREVTFPLRLKM